MADIAQPGSPPSGAGQKRKTLPRDMSDFLIEFSIALHKHAMYPGGHPTLDPAAERVARRLESLLIERGQLSLGVARDQLIIEGVATDAGNPVLRDLASRLHRHQLGAVTFNRGMTWNELRQALTVLATETEKDADPLGLRDRSKIPSWPHVKLFPLTFEKLELVGDADEAAGESVSSGRSALLWVGLARAAMAAGEEEAPEAEGAEAKPLSDAEIEAALSDVQAGELEAKSAEPAVVAKAIESHERGTAYDQVIVGYLLQIADELKGTRGVEAAALRKKMSRLITSLDTGTMSRLLEMGGDLGQRRQFLLDASQGMAAEAVVDLVRAASGTGAPVSQAMLRMLSKLGHHAERGPSARRMIADTELRAQVSELLTGWQLDDPNPGRYAAALEKMALAAPTMVAATEQAYAPGPVRMVQMAVEAGGSGPGLDRAVEVLITRKEVPRLLDLLARAPRENEATEAVRSRVMDPGMLKIALAAQPVDFELADSVIKGLGELAVHPMLQVLAESESRQVRRGLIDRLIAMGEVVRPALEKQLSDPRWYVLRNALYISAELPGTPSLDVGGLLEHEDARVRREAVRVQFRQPAERTRAICSALGDADERIRRLAIVSATEGGVPEAAVTMLAAIAASEVESDELRIPAMRALGASGSRLALEPLMRLAAGRRRSVVARMLSAPEAPKAQVAAVAALGAYARQERVRGLLQQFAGSKDAALAKAARDALEGAQ